MKKKRKASKRKIRFFFAFLVFSSITAILGYDLFCNIINIRKMSESKKLLADQIAELKEEKQELEADILKLNDSEYIAKYVREKYFYSKKNELILRIDE